MRHAGLVVVFAVGVLAVSGSASAISTASGPVKTRQPHTKGLVPVGQGVASAAASAPQTGVPPGAAVSAELQSAVDALRAAFDRPSAAAERLEAAQVSTSTTGHVRGLVAPPGRGWTAKGGADPGPEGRALAFLSDNRLAFGWASEGAGFRTERSQDASGRHFVRLEQRVAGLPVFGAYASVQVEADGSIPFVISDIARDGAKLFESSFPTKPVASSEKAVAAAIALLADRHASDLAPSTPELMLYEPTVIGNAGPSQLVWNLRVKSALAPVNEVVLVDAVNGEVAFHYSDIQEALHRQIYDSGNTSNLPGTLVRSEGQGPASVADANLAYDYFGDTYGFFANRFGRDSYDGAGAALVARVRFCEPGNDCPFTNAYWNGSEMRFGQGYASADDVVAHELSHAVTERSSGLIYWSESGAINEAMSDIFGELVDLTNGRGNDSASVRWLLGEDLPIGAVRNMSNPPAYGDPDRRFSSYWYKGLSDGAGVHTNSGVANKLGYLLTDGGTFNGQTVAAQGIDATASLFYYVNSYLLTPASDYYDLDLALLQASTNLGWGASSRSALDAAQRAVEIALPGTVTTRVWDDFESGFSWSVSGSGWGRSSKRAAGGSYSAYCAAAFGSTNNYPDYMNTSMVLGPFPAGQAAWLEFDWFIDSEGNYDYFSWEFSGDGVTYYYPSRISGYSGQWLHHVVNVRDAMGSQPQQVWLRFRFTSDLSNLRAYEGVYVDNVVFRTAAAAANLSITNSSGGDGVRAGQNVTYTIRAANAGPDGVSDALVTDSFPSSLTGVSWTCSGAGGGSCSSASGSGAISSTVGLPVGGTATFTATGTLSIYQPAGTLTNTATISSPSDPSPADNSATDNDTIIPLTVSIDDDAVNEENAGTTNATFHASLSHPVTTPVWVMWWTSDGTAVSGADYVYGIGNLDLPAGTTSLPFTVGILGDTTVELDEDFFVDITAAVTVARSRGVGTILDDDAASLSSRELVHGAREGNDLRAVGGVADVDHYRIAQQPRSCYEVVVEGASGDISPVIVERLGANNTTVLQSAQPVSGVGHARSLRWVNGLDAPVKSQTIRVRGNPSCTTCGADDVYTIRSYETTTTIPRFNNSSSQMTVLMLQNPTDTTIAGTIYFWSAGGTLHGSRDFSIGARATMILNTATVTELVGQSGAITIVHDGRYGDLTGKAVALEPATGFGFDSPMTWRP